MLITYYDSSVVTRPWVSFDSSAPSFEAQGRSPADATIRLLARINRLPSLFASQQFTTPPAPYTTPSGVDVWYDELYREWIAVREQHSGFDLAWGYGRTPHAATVNCLMWSSAALPQLTTGWGRLDWPDDMSAPFLTQRPLDYSCPFGMSAAPMTAPPAPRPVDRNRLWSVTYETWDDEARELGETNDKGWVEDACSFREAVNAAGGVSAEYHPDGYPATPRDVRWLVNHDFCQSFLTSETEERHLHIPDHITPSSRARVLRLLGVRID